MSFLGNKELKEVLPSCLGRYYKEERIDSGKYELSLGGNFYASDSDEFKVKELPEGDSFVINPGQFAMLITQEFIEIPTNYIGFISIKTKMKFRGLINVSGFHVDPGFRGRLKYSVYNAGSNQVCLKIGDATFQLWLSKLTSETQYSGSHQNQTSITTNDLMNYMQGSVASPAQLKKEIQELKSRKEMNSWVLKSLLVVVFGILINVWWSWVPFHNDIKTSISNDLKDSLIVEVKKAKIDSLVNLSLVKELEKAKIDSLVNLSLVKELEKLKNKPPG
jgi:dCTP deaminase